MDRTLWPSLSSFFTTSFLSKTREEWTSIFLHTDACCVPVLNRHEVDKDGLGYDEPRVDASEMKEGDGGVPSAAPKLSRTPAGGGEAYDGKGEGFFLEPGKHTRSILEEAGLGKSKMRCLCCWESEHMLMILLPHSVRF